MIELSEISKWYGPIRALSAVSLTVAPGTALGLVGPNGAGKSTLLRIACGLSRPDAGQVRLNGKDAVLDPAVRRDLGCMPDNLPLFELLTGREQLVWTGGLLGVDRATSERRIRELAEALELTEALDRPIGAYSTGMRKKIAFMNALIGDPDVLVLDEPFEGVDLLGIYTMKDVLAQLVGAGASLLVSSHILPLIGDLCSEFALLHQGSVVLHGNQEALRAPAANIHPQTNPQRTDLESVFLDIIAPDRRARRLESIGRR
jgi:ABC-2 type transport system ATP-binding protein